MTKKLFLSNWPKRLGATFAAMKIDTWEGLAALTPAQLLVCKGVGKHYLSISKRRLAARGLELGQGPATDAWRLARHGASPLPATCGVYFIRCEGFVKIGFTRDLTRRFVAMQHTNPFEIEIVGFIECADWKEARAHERELHRQFQQQRERLEWFRFDGPVRAFVETLHREGQ